MNKGFAFALVILAACSGEVVERVAEPEPTERGTYIAVKGDWGSGTDKQRLVTSEMCRWRANGYAFQDVITTGDNFYSPDGRATKSNFHEPERCLEGITWRASWGNHDVADDDTGSVLGAERWYAWKRDGVTFIALDSNQPANPAQRGWLEEQLRRARNEPVVTYFHHPPYTGAYHPPDRGVLRHWVPLFRKYGVDLVLSGHNHNYEHHIVDGIDYVVTGGGGRQLYPCIRKPATMLKCDDVYHFLLLTIRQDAIGVRAIRGTGPTLDAFDVALR